MSDMYRAVLAALLALLLCAVIAAAEDEQTYLAAVVEHVPVMSSSHSVTRSEALEVMEANLDLYEEHLERALLTALMGGRQLQLIVFPEDGLYGASFLRRDSILPYLEPIPEPVPLSNGPSSSALPCDWSGAVAEASPILVRASCMARAANVTLVLDMGELQPCAGEEGCPDDGRYQFNTQVAFAENGQLIGKYHKSHLYYEPQFDEPQPPEIRYFDTSFGVRFGMMICFDVMFQLPQLDLYEELGIRDFTWTSWWVNVPPLITGTQTEVARSLQIPSNFLASGIGMSWYNSGSGIFSNGQSLRSWYNPTSEPKARVLVAEVPFLVAPFSLSSADTLRSDKRDTERETNGSYRDTTGDSFASQETVAESDTRTLSLSQSLSLSYTEAETAAMANVCDDLCCGCEEQLWVATPFTATSGLHATYTAVSRNLTCTATVSVAEEASDGAESFGVVAITGMYSDLFPGQVCALLRCSGDDCTGQSLRSHTVFDSWSITASLLPDQLFVLYPLVAVDYARVPPPESYVFSDTPAASPSLSSAQNGTVLLNAALFGLNRHLV
eukprot:CAMPEP_0114607780 /NCGR_PEP_ID=MMETSP0168-20121206/2240_1 /TAXON_ID=95228 ORGANISM="Vannella sp., Strain DIVA3 517/6/12" /NCGR_SAMPLE_ID=MMETSP0168 /ASSEMBLY_ACC=CAM_ASM_000044 /LENGTH=555 /DNA_ID=CAMNT_0001818659 /DNA_START=112 /DNA_END=1775 /DNA_ORIENTATION=+